MWPNPQFLADFVTFTEEILSGKLLFSCSDCFFWLFLQVINRITTASISIASFATVTRAPVGIVSASFSLAFSISTGIMKKLLKTTRNTKKKNNETVMPARSKLNSTESKISEALINT